ncbi:hypothetical protein C8F01DRAFT_960885, partial [Mycena amicta]
LQWSNRRATNAAQKLPANHERILEEAYLREAWIIKEYNIPAALRVNTDQTQVVYQQGGASTWGDCWAKQVSTTGKEEKRAFTLVPSIAADGLGFPHHPNSLLDHQLVNEIIGPYFERSKLEPKIDVWSVHRSEAFRDWMRENHPTITIQFIPGGCT